MLPAESVMPYDATAIEFFPPDTGPKEADLHLHRDFASQNLPFYLCTSCFGPDSQEPPKTQKDPFWENSQKHAVVL